MKREFTKEELKILSVLEEAAKEAGNIIRSYWNMNGKYRLEEKAPSDYVTEVDKQSENAIVNIIKKAFPKDIIVAEESNKEGSYAEKPVWIIDPLDGTTNFIHGFPMVAVSIGRFEEGEIRQGSVFDPIRQEFFWAVKGKGFFLGDKKILRTPDNISPKRSLVATGFPFRHRELLEGYLKSFRLIFHQVSDIRRAGSAALDLTYVATGRLDGFWEIGLSPWDVAAGILFIKESGGTVTDFSGNRSDPALLKGDIVAASSEELHKIMLNIVGNTIKERG